MNNNHVKSAVKLWGNLKGVSTSDLERRMSMPVSVLLLGTPANVQTITERLCRESPDDPVSGDPQLVRRATHAVGEGNSPHQGDQPVIDCDSAVVSEDILMRQLKEMSERNGKLRVALAANIPALRPVVVDHISREFATTNAKIAAISALPGIVPFGDIAIPLTSVGDIYLLTRNQMILFLEIAAIYGNAPDLRARVREFAAVFGGAFFWRAIARQLVGMVPGGVGVAVKSAVAYGGTYAVGQGGALYFRRGGHLVGPREISGLIRGGMKLSEANR